MASDHARVKRSIWQDPDFVALSPDAQRTYLLLLSQQKLTFCGTLDYLPQRWARLGRDVTAEDVERSVVELEQQRYVIVDRDTQELLIRSWVRHDGVCDSPNLIKAMWKAWTAVESHDLRRHVMDQLPEVAFDEGFGGAPKKGYQAPPEAFVERSSNPLPKGSEKGSTTPVPSPVPAPSPAPPLAGRLSAPASFVEIVDSGGAVAVRRETGAILDAANERATDKLTDSERRKLRPVVEDALRKGYDPNELADAIAVSPFRTDAAVMGELRAGRQSPRARRGAPPTKAETSAARILAELGGVN